MTYEQKIEALRLARELGFTASDIAQLFGIDRRQVQAWLNEMEQDE